MLLAGGIARRETPGRAFPGFFVADTAGRSVPVLLLEALELRHAGAAVGAAAGAGLEGVEGVAILEGGHDVLFRYVEAVADDLATRRLAGRRLIGLYAIAFASRRILVCWYWQGREKYGNQIVLYLWPRE